MDFSDFESGGEESSANKRGRLRNNKNRKWQRSTESSHVLIFSESARAYNSQKVKGQAPDG